MSYSDIHTDSSSSHTPTNSNTNINKTPTEPLHHIPPLTLEQKQSTILSFLSLYQQHIPSLHAITSLHHISQLIHINILVEFLQSIEPVYFDITINEDPDKSQTQLYEDLHIFYNALQLFYQETLNITLREDTVDLKKFVDDSDINEIMKLCELSLLCAINSTHKEDVIQTIMSMNEKQQTYMMYIINETMNSLSMSIPSSSSSSSTSSHTFTTLSTPKSTKHHHATLSHDHTHESHHLMTHLNIASSSSSSGSTAEGTNQLNSLTSSTNTILNTPYESHDKENNQQDRENPLKTLLHHQYTPSTHKLLYELEATTPLPHHKQQSSSDMTQSHDIHMPSNLPHHTTNHATSSSSKITLPANNIHRNSVLHSLPDIQHIQQQYEQENKRLHTEINTLQTQNKSLHTEVHKIQALYENLQSTYDTTVQHAVSKALELNEQQHKESKKTYEQKYLKQINELENKLEESHHTLKQHQLDYTTLLREKQQSVDENQVLKSEIQLLRDELQITKQKAENAVVLENKVQRLQSRLENTNDLHAQTSYLETQNQQYIYTISSLEQQIRELTVIKSTVQKYKDQIITIQHEYNESEIHVNTLQQQLLDTQTQANEYFNHIKQLQEQLKNQELLYHDLKTDYQKVEKSYHGLLEQQLNIAESKFLIQRLQEENTRLKQQSEEYKNSVEYKELWNDREKYKILCSEWEEKYQHMMQRINTLENTIKIQQHALKQHELYLQQNQNKNTSVNEEKQSSIPGPSPSSGSSSSSSSASNDTQLQELERLRKQCIELQERLIQSSKTRLEVEQQLEELKQNSIQQQHMNSNSKVSDVEYEKLVSELQNAHTRNKKLEVFVKSAHDKVRLTTAHIEDMKNNEKHLLQSLQQLKQQLMEKERELKERDQIRQDEQRASDRERKIITSAFYNLSLDYSAALANGRAISNRKDTGNSGSIFNEQQQQKWEIQQRKKLAE